MFVKKALNLFAIVIGSVIVSPVSLKRAGNDLLGLRVDNIALIVFHVFLRSCLKLVKHVSKYIRLATRMLLLKPALRLATLPTELSNSTSTTIHPPLRLPTGALRLTTSTTCSAQTDNLADNL